jgi:hypothetical protein
MVHTDLPTNLHLENLAIAVTVPMSAQPHATIKRLFAGIRNRAIPDRCRAADSSLAAASRQPREENHRQNHYPNQKYQHTFLPGHSTL